MADDFGPFAQFVHQPVASTAAPDFGPFVQFVHGTPGEQAQATAGDYHLTDIVPDVINGAVNFGGHGLAAVTPKGSAPYQFAQKLIADTDHPKSKLAASVLPTVVTLPLGGPVSKLGELAGGLAGAGTLKSLAAASAGRIAGNAGVGAGLGALETAGTDQDTASGAKSGAVAAGLLGGVLEAIPGAATAATAVAGRLGDRLRASQETVTKGIPHTAAPADIADLARRRGFTVREPGTPQTTEAHALEQRANRANLTQHLDRALADAGGELSDNQTLSAVVERVRPAVDRFGRETGGQFENFFNKIPAVVDPEKNPQFDAMVRQAIAAHKELPDKAQNKQFLDLAESLLVKDGRNPALGPQIDPRYGVRATPPSIPGSVKTTGLKGFDPESGTIPGHIAQKTASEYGYRTDTANPQITKSYSLLSKALRQAQEFGMTREQVARFKNMKDAYSYFKNELEGITSNDSTLVKKIATGDPKITGYLADILDPQDTKAVQQVIGQNLMTQIASKARNGLPSQHADPAALERAVAAISPEARAAFLPERDLEELTQISGRVLSPQEGSQITSKTLPPKGTTVSALRGLGFGVGGYVGGTLGHATGVPYAGYIGAAGGGAAGKLGADRVIEALLNVRRSVPTETLPLLTKQYAPALARAILLGGDGGQ